jgi:hypothetical protein
MPGTGEQAMGSMGTLELASILLLATILYLLPLAVAALRNTKQARHIALLDIALGWTVIGWAVALVWAVLDRPIEPLAVLADPNLDRHVEQHVHRDVSQPQLAPVVAGQQT